MGLNLKLMVAHWLIAFWRARQGLRVMNAGRFTGIGGRDERSKLEFFTTTSHLLLCLCNRGRRDGDNGLNFPLSAAMCRKARIIANQINT